MKKIKFSKPVLTFALTITLTTIFIIPIFNLKINPDLESYLPDEIQSKIDTEKINNIFGKNEPVIIIFESENILNTNTLKRIQNITNELENYDNFSKIYSITNAKEIINVNDFLTIKPLIENIPQSTNEIKTLKKKIIENDMVYKFIVSKDFTYSMIIANNNKKISDDLLNKKLHELLKKYPGHEKCYLYSQALLRDEANTKIAKDLYILLPIGLLVMIIFLYVSFRNINYVFMPISVVIIAIIFSFGLMGIFNIELSLIGVLIPIMMIAIANNYSIYIISRYQELYVNNKNQNKNILIKTTVDYLKKPVIITGLTTITGILGLVVHILIPAREMGIISAISIGFALFLSLTFVPSLISLTHKNEKLSANKNYDKRNKKSENFINFIINSPVKTLIIFIIFSLIAILGIFRFKVASDNNKVLPEKHEFNKAVKITDKEFGGSKIIHLLFEGNIKNPEVLKKINNYADTLRKEKNIGNVSSIADIIRKMSKVFNNPDEFAYDKIPDTEEEISQYLLLYSMNGDPEDLEHFIDFNYVNAIMNVQFSANNMSEINHIIKRIKEITKNDKNFKLIGGYSLIDKELCESVVWGQYYSLLFAFFSIFLLLILIFKSLNAGILGSLPLLLATLCTFGLMGWVGIELNIVTALLSSVSIGLGVDYTIHIFWRIMNESQYSTPENAVKNAILNTGKGITINAVSVMLGFSVLLLSSFPIIRSFAFLIIFSIFLCMTCSLILIPAISLIVRPKFLFNIKN